MGNGDIFWIAAPSGRLQRVITILQQQAEALILAEHTWFYVWQLSFYFYGCMKADANIF